MTYQYQIGIVGISVWVGSVDAQCDTVQTDGHQYECLEHCAIWNMVKVKEI